MCKILYKVFLDPWNIPRTVLLMSSDEIKTSYWRSQIVQYWLLILCLYGWILYMRENFSCLRGDCFRRQKKATNIKGSSQNYSSKAKKNQERIVQCNCIRTIEMLSSGLVKYYFLLIHCVAGPRCTKSC